MDSVLNNVDTFLLHSNDVSSRLLISSDLSLRTHSYSFHFDWCVIEDEEIRTTTWNEKDQMGKVK